MHQFLATNYLYLNWTKLAIWFKLTLFRNLDAGYESSAGNENFIESVNIHKTKENPFAVQITSINVNVFGVGVFTASWKIKNPQIETKYEDMSITLQSTHTKIIPFISINEEWCHIDWKTISKWFIFKSLRLTSSASSSLACVFPFVFVSAIFNDSCKRP
jgi:hypothetical protein